MPEAIDRTVFSELQQTAGADFVVELLDTFAEEAPHMSVVGTVVLRRPGVASPSEHRIRLRRSAGVAPWRGERPQGRLGGGS